MYWKQIPISEPPPKAGWYTMINSPHFIQVTFYWDGVWKNNEYDKEQSDLSMGHTHYLVPVTDEEVEEKDKAILILKHLCLLKQHKDEHGKDEYYEKEQPKIWQRANDYLNSIK
jgi:hypothetical protein